MERGRPKRPWIKMYPVDCLMGSINWQLDLPERCIWYELIYFSALCATPGVISDKDGRPYPHQFIANRLNAPLDVFERTLQKCVDEGRIFENDTGIHITNWAAYQSEYERQKPYRERKKEEAKEGEVTLHCPKCGHEKTLSSRPRGITDCPICKRAGKLIKMVEDR